MNGLDISTNTHVQIDLCVLRDACHELFCVFRDFYVSWTQYAEVTKSFPFLFVALLFPCIPLMFPLPFKTTSCAGSGSAWYLRGITFSTRYGWAHLTLWLIKLHVEFLFCELFCVNLHLLWQLQGYHDSRELLKEVILTVSNLEPISV